MHSVFPMSPTACTELGPSGAGTSNVKFNKRGDLEKGGVGAPGGGRMRQSASSALRPLQCQPPIVPAKPLAACHVIGPRRRERHAT
jgi:hypothetical protein